MTVGLYRDRWTREVRMFDPRRDPELADHPSVRWARVVRVVWRRR